MRLSDGDKTTITTGLGTYSGDLYLHSNDYFYMVNNSGQFYKINRSTGSKLLISTLSSAFYSGPLIKSEINNDNLLIPLYNGQLLLYEVSSSTTSLLLDLSPCHFDGGAMYLTNTDCIIVQTKDVFIYRIDLVSLEYEKIGYLHYGNDIVAGGMMDINDNNYFYITCFSTKRIWRVQAFPQNVKAHIYSCIKLHPTNTTSVLDSWCIYEDENQDMMFEYDKTKQFSINNTGTTGQLNKTITHNAPLSEKLENYNIGAPVFMSGYVYKLEYNKEHNYYYYKLSISEDNEDCIPAVKSKGNSNEFLGIITKKHIKNDNINIGDIIHTNININQDTINFATHGDFLFRVNNTINYNIGDTLLYNGDILNEDTIITLKLKHQIIGVITSKIDDIYLSVFQK